MDHHAVQDVEGIDPELAIFRSEAQTPLGLPPILLLHGFGSSSRRNWVDTGWVRFLNDSGRTVIMIDLPAHGGSAAPRDAGSYTPSRMRADILQALFDERVTPLDNQDLSSGVDVIGYSLGARLAWEFGATQPELVRRMVLGGPGSTDPLARLDLEAAKQYVAGGPVPADPSTAGLLRMAQAAPENDMPSLLAMATAIATEPFDPESAVPGMPVMLVAGDKDEYAVGLDDLARWAPAAEVAVLTGRDHAAAITARGFKELALSFLA